MVAAARPARARPAPLRAVRLGQTLSIRFTALSRARPRQDGSAGPQLANHFQVSQPRAPLSTPLGGAPSLAATGAVEHSWRVRRLPAQVKHSRATAAARRELKAFALANSAHAKPNTHETCLAIDKGATVPLEAP